MTILSRENLRSLVCPLPAEMGFNFDLYRSVLQLGDKIYLFNPNGLLFRGHDREKYLEELIHSVSSGPFSSVAVVLLDPDKGIHNSKKSNKYIALSEVADLARQNPNKTIAIYHHKNAGGFDYRTLLERLSHFNTFAYDFGAAAIFFIQNGTQPMTRIKDILYSGLNPKRLLEKGI